MHIQEDQFAGWESYPQNLPLSSIEVCSRRYNERLSCAREKLFVSHDENQVGTLMFGPAGPEHEHGIRDVDFGTIESTTQLRTYFERKCSSRVLCSIPSLIIVHGTPF